MTVLDTSAVLDYLLGDGVAAAVEELLSDNRVGAAPDLMVFEVLAVLRRDVRRGVIPAERALGAIEDLGDLPIELYPSLVLRGRAWALRENLTVTDALFVALAEQLGEPLATKDRALASAARVHASADVIELTPQRDG